MKKNTILIKAICIVTLIFIQINLNAQKNKVIYNINGKPVTYYALSRDSLTHISVTGPGKLTIITRAHFVSNSTDSLSYGILYVCDNAKIKVHKVKNVVREDSNVVIQGVNDVPSRSRTFTIKVDPDIHDYSFVMQNESPQVDLHYKFVSDSVPKWKDIGSFNDTSRVNLIVDKSNIQSYYRFSSNQFQKYKVKGPTSLRVITRLEYDYTMQGLLSYRVCVKRNDTIIGTFKLSAIPSVEAQYVNDKKYIPGKLMKFYLEVPSGENYYEFTLLDKHFTSLIRVSRQKN